MPEGIGHVQKLFLGLPSCNKAGNENSGEAERWQNRESEQCDGIRACDHGLVHRNEERRCSSRLDVPYKSNVLLQRQRGEGKA